MKCARVGLGVSGRVDRRIELENVAAFGFRPQREAWDDRRSAMSGQFGEACRYASWDAEEVDEDAFAESGVLIDQHTHRLVLAQRAQDASGIVALFNYVVARYGAAAGHQRIDPVIVKRAHHDMHGLLRQNGLSEGAQLPVAEVRRDEQNAVAFLHRGFEVLKAVVTNPIGNVLGIDLREAGEGDEDARDRVKAAFDNAVMIIDREGRKRHADVALRGAAQPGDSAIEQADVDARQAVRPTPWAYAQRRNDGAGRGILDPGAKR